MADDAWRNRLKAEVPKAAIPAFLGDLQVLVAGLRRFRDNLKIPSVVEVVPLLAPSLRAHPGLVVAYLDDRRYAVVVEAAFSVR